MKDYVMSLVRKERAILIFRGISRDRLMDALKVCSRTGVRMAEIPFDASGTVSPEETAETISLVRRTFDGEIEVGAGTVINVEQAKLAHQAGATYLISPDTSAAVIRYANENGLVSMPGAMTPTEISEAYRLGADFVKVFPADSLGLSYIKAIRAPLSHIPMLAVGGVDEKNVTDFLKAGLCGVGIGGGIVKKKAIEAGMLDDFEIACRTLKTAISDFHIEA